MQTPGFTFQDSSLPPVAVAGAQEFNRQAGLEPRLEFEDVLSHHLPRFRRMAFRWLRNPEDAEDAVQDALLSAFKHIARFEGRAQMSSWLMAIVINSVRMQLRRRPRHKILSIDQDLEDSQWTIADMLADPRPTPEQMLEQSELCEIAARLARSLPLSQRTALQLRQRDGLSTKEAAEVLGVPEGTLKSQLARGRAKLTQRLRKAVGASGTQTSSPDSKASRKASSGSRRRHDIGQGAVPLPIKGLTEQGGCGNWMGA